MIPIKGPIDVCQMHVVPVASRPVYGGGQRLAIVLWIVLSMFEASPEQMRLSARSRLALKGGDAVKSSEREL